MSQPNTTQPGRGSVEGGPASKDGELPKTNDKARRRNRVINSCLQCRRRKMKCDRGDPCANCHTSGRECAYLKPVDDTNDEFRLRLEKMKDARDEIESSIQDKPEASNLHPQGAIPHRKRSRRSDEVLSEESDSSADDGALEPTPLAIPDAAYSDDTDIDVEDLGIRIGRMRLGERIGSLYRPRIADEILSSLEQIPSRSSSAVPSTSALNQAEGSEKPTPSSTTSVDFVFSSQFSNETPLASLPSRRIADRLLKHYWSSVHPVARILHRPSFAQRYETLWEAIDNGNQDQIAPSLTAIVLSVLFSAAVSMSDAQVWETYGTPREELQNKLKSGVELSFGKARLLNTTKIETLQAFVAYLLPICVGNITRAHSVLTSMAIRMAECMGLHRDPSEYGFSPTECQVRRLIWYQICYLDLKTSEVQGPRPYIHHDGYTTQMPCPSTMQSWNDLIFSMVRFECQELQRKCLVLRNKIDQKRISLTKALFKIDASRLNIEEKYSRFLSSPTPSPIQKMTRVVMKLFNSLIYLIPLHRYMNSVNYRIPDRLRQIVLTKGTEGLEAAVELEMDEDLNQWSWYSSSYQQYHAAFLLLVEVFTFPMRREASRIWRCLDFIFADVLGNIPPLNSSMARPALQDVIAHRDIKARYLLTIICNRMRAYQKTKGFKNPVHFKDSMIILTPQKDGDSSDPHMPLNSTNDDASELTRPPTMMPHHLMPPQTVPPVTTGNPQLHYTTADHPGLTAPPQSWHNEWASSGQEFSSWVWCDETASDGASVPNHEFLDPRHQALGITPTGSATYSYQGESQADMGEMDPPMLEIDWSLWDTIFPPGINDGNLNISDNYLPEPYDFQPYMY